MRRNYDVPSHFFMMKWLSNMGIDLRNRDLKRDHLDVHHQMGFLTKALRRDLIL